MRFQITDYELGEAKTDVEAPGAAEAMLEYLPWPALNIEMTFEPSNGLAIIIDKQTEFKYAVQAM